MSPPTMHTRGDVSRPFQEMVAALEAPLERPPFEIGEHTDLGLLLIIAAESFADFEPKPVGRPADENPQIEALVRDYESLGPDGLAQHFTTYALDPLVLVHSSGLGMVRADRVDDSDVVEQMRKYPLKSPRDITITNVQVVHIGGSRAAVTYTVDENFSDGSSIHSNAVAIVVKVAAGWRIAVVSDHIDS